MPNPNEPLTIGAWPGGVAPLQSTPLTSSDDRTHLMNEPCWCVPEVIVFDGQPGERGQIIHRSPAEQRQDDADEVPTP